MTQDSIAYLALAIQRVERGDAASGEGSHVAGIFLRTANRFEKKIRNNVVALLRSCGLNYDQQIRLAIKGPALHKLTLGNCVAVMRESSNLRPKCVASMIPAGWTLDTFLQAISKINEAWVNVKHGDDVKQSVLVSQMKSMLTVYQALER